MGTHNITCLFVRCVWTVHVAVAAPPPRHAVAIAAGKLVLAVALAGRAVRLVAAVPAIVLLGPDSIEKLWFDLCLKK